MAVKNVVVSQMGRLAMRRGDQAWAVAGFWMSTTNNGREMPRSTPPCWRLTPIGGGWF